MLSILAKILFLNTIGIFSLAIDLASMIFKALPEASESRLWKSISCQFLTTHDSPVNPFFPASSAFTFIEAEAKVCFLDMGFQ